MIYLLIGKKNSGKDTSAGILTGLLEETFCYALAEPLKSTISQLFCLEREFLHDPTLKEMIVPEWNKTPRQIMQSFGTYMRTEFSPDFWLLIAEERLSQHLDTNIIITDIRYLNEIEFFENMAIRLSTKITKIYISRESNSEIDTHESESLNLSEIKVDHIIDNNGTIDDLRESFEKILS